MFTEQMNGLGPLLLDLGEKYSVWNLPFPWVTKQLNIFHMSESMLDACGVSYFILTAWFLAGSIIPQLYTL